jgi:hypothetical protein
MAERGWHDTEPPRRGAKAEPPSESSHPATGVRTCDCGGGVHRVGALTKRPWSGTQRCQLSSRPGPPPRVMRGRCGGGHELALVCVVAPGAICPVICHSGPTACEKRALVRRQVRKKFSHSSVLAAQLACRVISAPPRAVTTASSSSRFALVPRRDATTSIVSSSRSITSISRMG